MELTEKVFQGFFIRTPYRRTNSNIRFSETNVRLLGSASPDLSGDCGSPLRSVRNDRAYLTANGVRGAIVILKLVNEK
jgi:hypothetical protein